jgi:acyl carrier protein
MINSTVSIEGVHVRVVAIVQDILGCDGESLSDNVDLGSELGMTSVQYLDVVVAIEREFCCQLPADGVYAVGRLRELTNLVHHNLQS